MIVKCIVAVINKSGEPDLYPDKVDCYLQQYNDGEHYGAANDKADDNNYESKLCYDENDSAGKLMLPIFNWDSVPTVRV